MHEKVVGAVLFAAGDTTTSIVRLEDGSYRPS